MKVNISDIWFKVFAIVPGLISGLFFCSIIILGQQSQAAGTSAITQNQNSQLSLAYTHMLPSAYVIPGESFEIGTSIGFGLFDVADITSNLFYDLSGIYNVAAKIALWNGDDFAFAIFAGYTTQSIDVVDPVTSAVTQKTFTSFSPGAVLSYRIDTDIIGHAGITVVSYNPSITKSSLTKRSGYIHGSTFYKEFGFGLGNNVALVPGGTYDATFNIWGAGLSLHAAGFQVGAHYYFNVDEGAILPIFGVGYAASY